MSLEKIKQDRIDKLEALKKAGVNPYPSKSGRDFLVSDAIAQFEALSQKKQKITDLAGAWSDMSDTEWKRIRTEIKRGWKKWKAPSV